ncbi:MAG TPA: hypothetical protein VIJ64_13735 [Candidatus Lustribacter sp.]
MSKPRVGSIAHRDLFCRTFVETHLPFEPESLPWPRLEPRYVELLRAFPFWSFARSMEQEADRMIAAFSMTLADPTIREAVELQGYEEGRHGRLLNHMLERYEIDVPSVPLSNLAVRRDDFVVFGFSECTDSFVGFGGFALARQKQIFPKPLLDVFEHILFEEARHIVFFINWWRYEEALSGNASAFARTIAALKYHVRAVMHTAQGAQGAAVVPAPLDLTGGGSQAVLDGVTPKMFLEAALAEERAMMARIDRRLLRPRIVPFLATAALLGLRMLPPRKETIKRALAVAS